MDFLDRNKYGDEKSQNEKKWREKKFKHKFNIFLIARNYTEKKYVRVSIESCEAEIVTRKGEVAHGLAAGKELNLAEKRGWLSWRKMEKK